MTNYSTRFYIKHLTLIGEKRRINGRDFYLKYDRLVVLDEYDFKFESNVLSKTFSKNSKSRGCIYTIPNSTYIPFLSLFILSSYSCTIKSFHCPGLFQK